MNKPPTSGRWAAPNALALAKGERPARRVIGWLVVAVLAAHLALLWGMTGSLDWRLQTAEPMRVAPLQTRWVPPAVPAPAPTAAPRAQARTRVATVAPMATTTDAVAAPPPSEAAAPPETNETPATTAPPTEADKTAEVSTEVTANPPLAEAANLPDAVLSTAPTPQAAPAPSASSTALHPIPLGALPPSVLLSYRLTGQEKGLNYFANGELRWQHNDSAYALSLSVKAFLVGSRHWRSVGEITEAGLAPKRFSDSWRNERAAHFDLPNQRVVFSNNAPAAPLEAGAQDQISLYVQLAAAMAGDPKRFEPGTRVQVQTATIRDALPWLLTLGDTETLQLDGLAVPTAKWVCQPRNRFDATVEFWVSAQHAWMPVRIRITQVSGSFIDLMLRDQEALPPLPVQASPAPAPAAAAG